MKSRLALVPLLLSFASLAFAQHVTETRYTTKPDIPYYPANNESTEYRASRCRLDVYYPVDTPGYSTVVWFHGGGLKSGNKSFPKQLLDQGIAVVAVNYRMHPKVNAPVYIEDAAASVAWTLRNIESFGGNPERVFVSGHSAGGYLTSMVGLDKRYLAKHDLDTRRIAGLIPFSGHTITHFTIRAERGIDGNQPIVDEMAPLFHVRKDAPSILFITGDRDLEMLGRYEENAYMWRMMQVIGHPDAELHELQGFNHGQMAEPAFPLLLRFIREHSR